MNTCRVLLLSLLLLSNFVLADGQISGLWKHTEKPAWLALEFKSGVGSLSVKRHDNAKSAELNVIKRIVADPDSSSQWLGQMYSAADNGYIDIVLILINPNTLAVFKSTDVNQSNQILRLARE